MALLHTEQIMEMGAMGVDGNGWELWEPSGRLGGMREMGNENKKSEKDYFSLFSSSRILSILMVALMAASVWSASSARVL